MQKKKVPMGLVLGLCGLIAIAVIANGSQALQDAGLFQKKPAQNVAANPPTSLTREEERAQREQLRESIRSTGPTRGAEMTPTTPDGKKAAGFNDKGVPEKPAIFIEPEITIKPIQNDSSTASQWWSANHRLDKKAKEVAAGKK